MDFSPKTPAARRGPSSRLLKRQSLMVEQKAAAFSPNQSMNNTSRNHDTSALFSTSRLEDEIQEPYSTILGSPNVTKPIYNYKNKTAQRLMDITKPMISKSFYSPQTSSNLPLSRDAEAEVRATENLFIDFLASSSSEPSSAAAALEETLDQVADFEQLLNDHVLALKTALSTKKHMSRDNKLDPVRAANKTLISERNSWRLIGKLFADELKPDAEDMNSIEDEDAELLAISESKSEVKLVNRLFRKSRDLRRAQAVVDWLELNARDEAQELFDNTDVYGDLLVGMENTLHVLQQRQKGGKTGPTGAMVTELDPDARARTRRPLHELDEQDLSRLFKSIFICIRSGDLEFAQDLCVRVGQPWRAATLNGWKLYNDPNFEVEQGVGGEKLPVEGNPNRDIWKRSAWWMSEDGDRIPAKERAIYSALCGNAGQLLKSGFVNSWEDYVWALVRCAVDVTVEREIRESIIVKNRPYVDLPNKYWDSKTNLEEILDSTASVEVGGVKNEISSPYRVIQTKIILEDWGSLYEKLLTWTADVEALVNQPHLLRFLSHLVIVLRRLDIANHVTIREEIKNLAEENVLAAYVSYLIKSERIPQVAYYTSQLANRDSQIEVYSQFLAGVDHDADRRSCLQAAAENNLPLYEIRVKTVTDILDAMKAEEEVGETEQVGAEKLTEETVTKINALDILLYEPAESVDALIEANALTRFFVASKRIEAAKITLEKMAKIAAGIRSEQRDKDEDEEDECSPADVLARDYLKEYDCLVAFIDAKTAFSDWFEYLHKGKPRKPTANDTSMAFGGQQEAFTSKIALEQRERQYNVDYSRWEGALLVQSREVVARLNDLLNFPDGWLESSIDPEVEVRHSGRPLELDYLRRTCLVEVVFLLHNVLHSTKQYREALKLSDTVAAESKGALYQVFSKEDMKKLLQKLRESSIAMMEEESKDPWGF